MASIMAMRLFDEAGVKLEARALGLEAQQASVT
jgi:hypothetical protein